MFLARAGHAGNDNKLHISLLLPDADLGFELHAGGLQHARLHEFHRSTDIVGVAPPRLTTNPACFFRHRCTADSLLLEPGLLDERAREISHRRLNVLPADGSSSGCEALRFFPSARASSARSYPGRRAAAAKTRARSRTAASDRRSCGSRRRKPRRSASARFRPCGRPSHWSRPVSFPRRRRPRSYTRRRRASREYRAQIPGRSARDFWQRPPSGPGFHLRRPEVRSALPAGFRSARPSGR